MLGLLAPIGAAAQAEPDWCGWGQEPLVGGCGCSCPSLPTTGAQKTLYLLIDNDNVPGVPASVAQIEDIAQDVDDWFLEVSDGLTWMDWDVVPAWYVTTDQDYCNGEQGAVTQAALAGVPIADFDRLVFLHSFQDGPIGGIASCRDMDLPGGGSVCRRSAIVYGMRTDERKFVDLLHELGHGFGLGHARHEHPVTGARATYGNRADIMGGARSLGRVHFNAREKELLGWFDPGQVVEVTESGDHVLTPVATAAGVKALRVEIPEVSDSDTYPRAFWIEYRAPLGYDAPMAWHYNVATGALVNLEYANSTTSLDGTPESPSENSLDFALSVGRTMVLRDRVAVTVLANDTVNHHLAVRVRFLDHRNRLPRVDDVAVTYTPLGGDDVRVGLTATATDPDGDAPRYFWSFGPDPFAGDFFEPGTFGTGQSTSFDVTDDGTAPTRVFLLVADARGGESCWYPVDLAFGTTDSIHEVPGEYATVQAAVDAAAHGDLVRLAPGVHAGPGNRDVDLGGKAISVTSSAGAAGTTIDCEDVGRGFVLQSGEDYRSVVADLTIANGAATHGAGIAIAATSAPTVRGVVLRDNEASGDGGGLHVAGQPRRLRVHSSRFLDNAAARGGGLAVDVTAGTSSHYAFRDLEFAGNAAATEGGGAWHDTPVDFLRCVFRGNTAVDTGGAIQGDGILGLFDSVCAGNEADYGGALSLDDVQSSRDSSLWNVTLAGNTATTGGGAIRLGTERLSIRNSIVWGNPPFSLYGYVPSYTIDWSDVDGWTGGGAGNIDADPLFVAPELGDWRLSAGSPCIDAGDGDAALGADVEGGSRFDDASTTDTGTGTPTYTDMGAHEHRGPAPTILAVDAVNGFVDLEWSASSGFNASYRIYRATEPTGPWDLAGATLGGGTTFRDWHGQANAPDLHLWYRVARFIAGGEAASAPALAVPICARLSHVAGQPFAVDLTDFTVFSSLIYQPWQPLSVYADMAGGPGGVPDGQVTLPDYVVFQEWFLWMEP